MRRVEAVTGENALVWVQELDQRVNEARGRAEGAGDRARREDRPDARQREGAREGAGAAEVESWPRAQGDDLAGQAVEVNGLKVLAATLEGADATTLRETMDKLKDKLKSAAIVLAAVDGGKVQPDRRRDRRCDRASEGAANWSTSSRSQVGGKGGGRPDMAQAGGTEPARLAGALAGVADWVRERA